MESDYSYSYCGNSKFKWKKGITNWSGDILMPHHSFVRTKDCQIIYTTYFPGGSGGKNETEGDIYLKIYSEIKTIFSHTRGILSTFLFSHQIKKKLFKKKQKKFENI